MIYDEVRKTGHNSIFHDSFPEISPLKYSPVVTA